MLPLPNYILQPVNLITSGSKCRNVELKNHMHAEKIYEVMSLRYDAKMACIFNRARHTREHEM